MSSPSSSSSPRPAPRRTATLRPLTRKNAASSDKYLEWTNSPQLAPDIAAYRARAAAAAASAPTTTVRPASRVDASHALPVARARPPCRQKAATQRHAQLTATPPSPPSPVCSSLTRSHTPPSPLPMRTPPSPGAMSMNTPPSPLTLPHRTSASKNNTPPATPRYNPAKPPLPPGHAKRQAPSPSPRSRPPTPSHARNATPKPVAPRQMPAAAAGAAPKSGSARRTGAAFKGSSARGAAQEETPPARGGWRPFWKPLKPGNETAEAGGRRVGARRSTQRHTSVAVLVAHAVPEHMAVVGEWRLDGGARTVGAVVSGSNAGVAMAKVAGHIRGVV